jgi:hypothetical protein
VSGNWADRCDFGEDTTTDSLAPNGEPTSLIIIQPQTSATELLLQNAVLVAEILDDCILLTGNLARHGGDQDLPRLEDRGHRPIMPTSRDNGQLSASAETA